MSPPANEKPAPEADHGSGRDLTSQVLNLLRSPEFQEEIQYLLRDAVRVIHDELGDIKFEEQERAMDGYLASAAWAASPRRKRTRPIAEASEPESRLRGPVIRDTIMKKPGGDQP